MHSQKIDSAQFRYRPVATASASSLFQCLAIFSARGSSGLGALKSAWILPELANMKYCHWAAPGSPPNPLNNQHSKLNSKVTLKAAPSDPFQSIQNLQEMKIFPVQLKLFRCWNFPKSTNKQRDQNHQNLKANLSKTVRIWSAGLHLSFSMSKHMRPSCIHKKSTDPVVLDVLWQNLLEFDDIEDTCKDTKTIRATKSNGAKMIQKSSSI